MKNNVVFLLLGFIIGALWAQNRKLTTQPVIVTPAQPTPRKSRTPEEMSPTYKAWADHIRQTQSRPPMPTPKQFRRTFYQIVRDFAQPDLTELEADTIRRALNDYIAVMMNEVEQIVQQYDIPMWEEEEDDDAG